LARFAACGAVLGAALWFAARFATAHFSQLNALRDEAALLLLVVAGTIVYAGSILILFGRGWLRSLVRS
jgi:putative peptidoglycan lipid II flippase